MPLFNRDSDDPTSTASPQSYTAPPRRQEPSAGSNRSTYVAAGTRLTGEITGDTDVVIDGEFEGRLDVGSAVTIGSTGVVNGQIQAQSVQVVGKVIGDIHCRDRLELESSGKVEGDLIAPTITIADGAYIKGKVEMTSGAKGELL